MLRFVEHISRTAIEGNQPTGDTFVGLLYICFG